MLIPRKQATDPLEPNEGNIGMVITKLRKLVTDPLEPNKGTYGQSLIELLQKGIAVATGNAKLAASDELGQTKKNPVQRSGGA